ncbi:MAG: hypothetical protein O2983_00085 [Planctomycetota bacterium]|nr:hypothetical protein [Planctomycetota bacterium]MDA1157978.1 hypothetical protein [Planctomycetota bacterium]
MNDVDLQEALLESRVVSIDGREMFRVRFSRRVNSVSESMRRHGIIHESVVNEYCEALKQHYRVLCGLDSDYHWAPLTLPDQLACPVILQDLGSGLMGAATTDGMTSPYLALSTRSHEATPSLASRRRANVVLHELVHLLQFQTQTWNYWPQRDCWGLADPNWWLHEAVALAIEAESGIAPVSWYPWLWNWATKPQTALDADSHGACAAPFLQFLIRRFGRSIASSIYRITPSDVASMRATKVLAHTIRQTVDPQNVESVSDIFQSVFLDYCTDAALVGSGAATMDDAITQVVGQRMRTAVFSEFPVHWSDPSAEINHLACRYFEFVPPENKVCLKVSVTPEASESLPVVVGSLVALSREDQVLSSARLCRSLSVGELSNSIPLNNQTSRVLLTVANTAHGTGWAQHDMARVSITATVD